MKTVEHVAHIDLVLVGEHLPAVKIFIGIQFAVGKQPQYYAEEVFLPVNHLLRVVEGRIFHLVKVNLAIDDFHPLCIGVAAFRLVEKLLHTVGDTRRFFGVLLLGVPAAFAHDRRT